jgi:predicted DNA-binding transcriptional regulator AlpA
MERSQRESEGKQEKQKIAPLFFPVYVPNVRKFLCTNRRDIMPHGTALEDAIRSKQYLRLPAVVALTGASKSSVYAWMNDPQISFPKAIRAGHRLVLWDRAAVEDWLARRAQASAI